MQEFNGNIKDFSKPRKGKIKQGYFYPKNPDKYMGDLTKIIYRSSWERSFLNFCDLSSDVLKYEIEPFSIKYLNPLTKRIHKYFIDFYVEFQSPDGIEKWLVEIKPIKHTQKPKRPKRQTAKSLKNFISAYKRYQMNMAKFKAATEFANLNGLKFDVVEVVNGQFKKINWKSSEHHK